MSKPVLKDFLNRMESAIQDVGKENTLNFKNVKIVTQNVKIVSNQVILVSVIFAHNMERHVRNVMKKNVMNANKVMF